MCSRPSILGSQRGTAAIEFALVLPMLAMLLLGIVGYGDRIFTAQALQQAANDGARAAIGGLDRAERGTLAIAATRTSLTRTGMLDASLATVAIDDDDATFLVRLSYDASARPLMTAGLVPMPGRTIVRTAAIRLESP
ncbi:TadE/TadG family type IV pilus assembly protein [Sphingomonas sp.]|uniref:TadE/TadG family type IV pilus assembly protein n=1 Tax=Sphingomonas sp. TaxID=28214 RepID=UPI003AFFF3AC